MKDKRVEINLGFLCNNQCRFCLTNVPLRERRFNSYEVLKRELRDYYKKGYRALGFLGGEPTIYPKITELVSFARRLGYNQIHIVSNGRKYSDKKFLTRLIKSGVTKFYVSIHSHRAEIEDYLTSVKGAFEEKIRGLYNLRYFQDKGAIKERIFLNTVINNLNYRYLEDIILFYSKMGFGDFRFDFIRPEGRALTNSKEMVPKYSQVMKYVRRALDLAGVLKVDLTFGAIPLCLFYKYNIRISPTALGEFNDLGTESSLGEDGTVKRFVVSERRRRHYKVKRGVCKNCVFDRICEGVWKNYVRIHGFKDFKPVKYS